jgi:hypothetical protein
MKNLLFLATLSLAALTAARAQEFKYKSNEFLLDTSKNTSDVTSDIPMITWITPEKIQTTTLETKVNIKLTIKSGAKVKKIVITIKDSKRGDQLAEKKIVDDQSVLSSEIIDYTLILPTGFSTIEVLAESENGGVSTSTREMIVGEKAVSESVALLRHDYALLFATDDYDYWSKLVNPINDTETIARELKDNYNFETEIVRNPTTDQIMVKLREYSQKEYAKLDQLLIFIAGHGQFDEAFGMGYVVGKNSLKNDKAKTSYLSHSNLRDVINNIPCEHIFLAMDVCFGGTFDQKLAGDRGGAEVYNEVSTSEFVMRKLQYKTRRYITSGGKEYVSDGIPGNHSPFARKVLEALRTYGGQDRVLTLPEVYVYVEKLDPQPRMGEFGDNKPGSDFVFVAK